ncbi:hypothetical protein ACVWZW_002045 [Bradyrhizobium sp. F1.13.4]
MTKNDVFVYQAIKTPQFWLIWIVLFCNTTAGIGVLGQASAMSQEMFPGQITAVAAAGLVGLMSLFNMGGRFSWASLSDFIGRKNTYFVYMVLGFALYVTVPYAGASGNVVLFVLCFLIIVSMYGGGFSTVPAYLRDMFGTRYVGAIHGILLTAWSMAGIAGPRADQLHPRIQRHPRRAEGAGLQHHHVHHGRTARGRLPRQPLRPCRRQAPSHERRQRRSRARARLSRGGTEGATMTTTSRSEASFSQLLLSWITYRVSQMAAIKPSHRASEIAAAAAASNNPSGA